MEMHEKKALMFLWLAVIPIIITLVTIAFIEDSNKPNRVAIGCPQNTEKVYLCCK